MKYTIVIAMLAVGVSAYASSEIVKGNVWAKMGFGTKDVIVYRVEDKANGAVCYVTANGSLPTANPSISCVK